VEIEYTEGTDLLSAELVKADSEYDVIVAPTNLGAKLYPSNETFHLDGVLTWGNLYVVARDEAVLSDADAVMALFGEAAVPGLVWKAAGNAACQEEWYPSVAEASQALLSGQADAALLAQPAAAAAMAKDDSLKIVEDVQTLWQEKEDSAQAGYPQASVFVRTDAGKEAVSKLADALADIDPTDAALTDVIDSVGADVIGVPNAQIAMKTWSAQNIRYVSGKDAKDDIALFLGKLGMDLPEGLIEQ
jgi:NitT/TauT family transport system substrate-binding protein